MNRDPRKGGSSLARSECSGSNLKSCACDLSQNLGVLRLNADWSAERGCRNLHEPPVQSCCHAGSITVLRPRGENIELKIVSIKQHPSHAGKPVWNVSVLLWEAERVGEGQTFVRGREY